MSFSIGGLHFPGAGRFNFLVTLVLFFSIRFVIFPAEEHTSRFEMDILSAGNAVVRAVVTHLFFPKPSTSIRSRSDFFRTGVAEDAGSPASGDGAAWTLY